LWPQDMPVDFTCRATTCPDYISIILAITSSAPIIITICCDNFSARLLIRYATYIYTCGTSVLLYCGPKRIENRFRSAKESSPQGWHLPPTSSSRLKLNYYAAAVSEPVPKIKQPIQQPKKKVEQPYISTKFIFVYIYDF